MKTLILVVVAFVLGSLATAALAQIKPAPSVPVPSFTIPESAIYLRDVTGRCLRLQLQTIDAKVVVVSVPSEACARLSALHTSQK